MRLRKILIISVDFPPHTDGVSTVSHELATRLADGGEDIIVIGPQAKGAQEYDAGQKFRVIRTPLYEYGYLRFIPILFVMPFIILRYRIKKVIAMNIAYGGIISYLLFKYLGFSYILWAYGYEFGKFENSPFMRKLYLKVYGRALFIAAITNFVKERLVKFGVSPERVVLIKPGTDPLKYYPFPVSDELRRRYGLQDKKIVMSVSRLIERKGIDMTIRAMQDVLKEYPNTVYLVIGQGPFKGRLEALARRMGVQESVYFVGRVSEAELLNLYNLCDLFVMPSRTLDDKGDIEGFGIVFLEAGACKKPVIGGLDGGMNEAIDNGRTGLLVNPFCIKDISGAIIKLLSEPDYAVKLGESGRRRILEELNWEKSISLFHNYMRAHNFQPVVL